jgi:hypothetical protein
LGFLNRDGNFEVGDEVTVRGTVTAAWPDGQVTVQIAGAGHKVTLQGDSGHIMPADAVPAPKTLGKPKRLV